ncbi:MAG TPA: MarP family serine protease [Acidimicrobiales bacterium]|nr:MarP family serine protease [Acidimicrobiales bacterium]
MNWLDAVLLVVLVLAALHGWRDGGARQILFLAGLWLGLWVGAELALPLGGLTAGAGRAAVAVAVVVAAALGMAVLAGLVGRRVAYVLHHLRVGVIDASAGLVVSVVGTVFALWLVGNIAASSRVPAVDRAVSDSWLLRTVDGVLPPLPAVFARVESFLAAEGFPVVFVDLPPVPSPAVPLPSAAAVAAGAARAAPSTVQVVGPACGAIVEGSGFVIDPGVVVTNAHVVAGDAHPRVVTTAGSRPATPVGFDPQLDVAVLRVPGLAAPALPVSTSAVPAGRAGVVLGYPNGGSLRAVAASVTATYHAVGLDIYDRALVTREIHELHATILPGDSGGPLVSLGPDGAGSPPAGSVIGLVFARSTDRPAVGYALTMGPVRAAVDRAEQATAPVSTGTCEG